MNLSELAARRSQQNRSRGGAGAIPPTRNAQKIMNVAQKMGSKGVNNQQATTRVIYDSVKLGITTTSTVITFFKDAKKRSYPLTNLQENKLQRGEFLAIDRMYLSILKTVTGVPENVVEIMPLGAFAEFMRLYRSDLDFKLDQTTVLSAMSMQSSQSFFNKNSQLSINDTVRAMAYGNDVRQMDSDLIIPELLTFQADLTIPIISALPAGFDFYLSLTFEGLGTLFSPKGTF